MRLTMEQRRAVIARTAGRYQRSGKKNKGVILDELVELTQYNRSYARRVLRHHGKRVVLGEQTLVGDARVRCQRRRSRVYDEKVSTALIRIWKIMDYICGKRLQPALAELVTVLERRRERGMGRDSM